MTNRKGGFGLRANLCIFRFWFPDGQLVRPGKLTISEDWSTQGDLSSDNINLCSLH